MCDGIQLSEAITGDGATIFRHACWMDLEGIVSGSGTLGEEVRRPGAPAPLADGLRSGAHFRPLPRGNSPRFNGGRDAYIEGRRCLDAFPPHNTTWEIKG